MIKKVGRPAFKDAKTHSFKLTEGEYRVVRILVDYLRDNFSHDVSYCDLALGVYASLRRLKEELEEKQ